MIGLPSRPPFFSLDDIVLRYLSEPLMENMKLGDPLPVRLSL